MTFLTSQRCTAMSIDTRIAVARFPGQFWWLTHTWVSGPPGFMQTPTHDPPKPVPLWQVRVCWGRGTGSPGKPKGYPQSLPLGAVPCRCRSFFKFLAALSMQH